MSRYLLLESSSNFPTQLKCGVSIIKAPKLSYHSEFMSWREKLGSSQFNVANNNNEISPFLDLL